MRLASLDEVPGLESLLPVHLLHRLHGLPLGEISGEAGNPGLRVSTELLIGSLLGHSLGLNSCAQQKGYHQYLDYKSVRTLHGSTVRRIGDLESLVLSLEGVNHAGNGDLFKDNSQFKVLVNH